jgi:hypothetical protein
LDWPEESVLVEWFKDFEPNNIQSVSMLGVDGELVWEMTADGLKVQRPKKKSCENANSFNIEYAKRLPWIYSTML